MKHLQSSVMSLQCEQHIELQSDIATPFVEQGFATLNGNMKRVAMQPVRHVATTTGIDLLARAADGTS
jgi:hypothetical protein